MFDGQFSSRTFSRTSPLDWRRVACLLLRRWSGSARREKLEQLRRKSPKVCLRWPRSGYRVTLLSRLIRPALTPTFLQIPACPSTARALGVVWSQRLTTNPAQRHRRNEYKLRRSIRGYVPMGNFGVALTILIVLLRPLIIAPYRLLRLRIRPASGFTRNSLR